MLHVLFIVKQTYHIVFFKIYSIKTFYKQRKSRKIRMPAA